MSRPGQVGSGPTFTFFLTWFFCKTGRLVGARFFIYFLFFIHLFFSTSFVSTLHNKINEQSILKAATHTPDLKVLSSGCQTMLTDSVQQPIQIRGERPARTNGPLCEEDSDPSDRPSRPGSLLRESAHIPQQSPWRGWITKQVRPNGVSVVMRRIVGKTIAWSLVICERKIELEILIRMQNIPF